MTKTAFFGNIFEALTNDYWVKERAAGKRNEGNKIEFHFHFHLSKKERVELAYTTPKL